MKCGVGMSFLFLSQKKSPLQQDIQDSIYAWFYLIVESKDRIWLQFYKHEFFHEISLNFEKQNIAMKE